MTEQRGRKARLKDRHMPPFLQSVTYLSPPKGPALVLTDNETWLGRASFDLSEEGQLRCSRKHACLKITNAVVTLECRGLNPIYFVVCHSVNFQASEDTPPSRLYHLKRGEAVELAAGDKFFLVPEECLLTVGIERGYDVESDGRQVPQLLRLISRGAVDPLNPTQRGTLTAGKSVDGRACSTSSDRTVVQGIQADTFRRGCDSRGPGKLAVKSNPDAHEAGKQIMTRNVSCGTSSRRISELSTKRGKSQTDSPSKSVPSSRSLPLDGISTTCAAYQVRDGEELRSKLPVDVTVSVGKGNSQAQALSQSAQVGRSMCNNNGTCPIDGMEQVIATVSGYNDLLRARLISLITAIGSSYTGSLTKVNTHVVCWKFRGPKFELAKKLGTKIINHRWFEDCFKVGIRLPEGPYQTSVELSEPLLWDPSSVQRPSSRAGFDRDHNCHSLLRSGERFVEQARAPLVIGGSRPSTYTHRIAKPFGQSAVSSPRAEIGTLDRGKRHVTLKGPASRFQDRDLGGSKQDCQELRQIRTLTGTRDVPPIDLTPHRAREQQSDEFWNEVIRANDDRKEQVTEHSSQVFSKRDHVTGRTNSLASPVPGSSLRELDPKFYDRRRNAITNEAESSTVVPCEILQEAMHSHSLVGDQSRNSQREVDHITSDPEVFERKEAFTFATMKRKRRRLVRKSEIEAAGAVPAGVLPSQVESTVGTIRDITTGGQPTLDSGAPLQRVATVDRKDECQQRVGMIEVSANMKGRRRRLVRKSEVAAAAGVPAGDLPSQVETMVGTIRDISTGGQPILDSGAPLQRIATVDRKYESQQRVGMIAVDSAVAAGDLPSQVGVAVGTIRDITTGGQPILDSGAPLQRVATVDRKDECQQRVGMIEVDSVGKIEVSATTKGKRRRLVRKSEVAAAAVPAGDLPSQVETMVGTIRDISTGGQPILDSGAPLQRVARVDRKDECQQRVGMIEVDSAVAAGDLPSQVEIAVGTIRDVTTGGQQTLDSGAPLQRVATVDRKDECQQRVGMIEVDSAVAAGDLPSQVESTVGTMRDITTGGQPILDSGAPLQRVATVDRKDESQQRVGMIPVDSAVAAGDFPSQVESTVGTMRDITTGGQPTLDSGAPLLRVATVDRKDDCQQRVGIIEVDSVGKSVEKAGEAAPSSEIACVICRSDTKPVTEGVLACGHQFCYPCIQRWADEAKLKSPSCPLCKVAFDFITFRGMDKAGEEGSCAVLEEKIVQICPQKLPEVRLTHRPWRTEIMCVTCEGTDTPELFLICCHCRERACHTFCLDPPRPLGSPWFCRRCFQTHSWMPIRQAY